MNTYTITFMLSKKAKTIRAHCFSLEGGWFKFYKVTWYRSLIACYPSAEVESVSIKDLK